MQVSELRSLSLTDLETKILELRKQQFSMRLKQANGTLDKTHQIQALRRSIARVKTILQEKQSEESRGK